MYRGINEEEQQLKRYTLYMFLGIVAGMFVIPVVFNWIGIPLPGRGYAKLLTTVFGEPGGVNSVFMLLFSGGLIVLILFGSIMLAKRLEKGNHPSSKREL